MTTPDLTGKRILLLGAETSRGRDIAAALAAAGARVALVAATKDDDTAFAVKRLGSKLGAELSLAVGATNEMAVRITVHHVSRALGGLDAVVFSADLGDATAAAADLVRWHVARGSARRGGEGRFVAAPPEGTTEDVLAALAAPAL